MKTRALTTVLLTALSLPVSSLATSAGSSDQPPNILLVIADDMGLDASHCYTAGNQQAPMPTLKKLCDNGLVFDNAYAAPVCSPTRASIISGQYGFQTGIGGAVPKRASSGGLSESVVSLFDLLYETNHSAALIGKWHLASAADGLNHPRALGVDHYFGLYSGRTNNYSDWQAVENGDPVNVRRYSTSVFTDHAIDWIAAQDNPWFLWLAHNAPHAPFHLPPTDLHTFTGLSDDESSINANPLPYYQAMLEAMDTELGRLLDSLSTEVRDNTRVIFLGDNGTPNQVAKNLYDHGAKGTLYESGIRVPMVISGPDIKPGRTDAFVSAVDLYATIASLAGANGSTSSSYDFSAVLSGGSTERNYIYAEHFSDRQPRGFDTHGWAIREGNTKLISISGRPPALYDLASDPGESNNLLNGKPSAEIVKIADALDKRRNALVQTGN